MPPRLPIKELAWFAPFLAIGFAVTALLRPTPVFPTPSQSRVVTDAEGIKVPIANPFRGIVLTWGAWGPGGYLENTRAPETMLRVGGPLQRAGFLKSIMGWIYPEVEKKSTLWDSELISKNEGPNAEIETLLAIDDGAYLGNGGDFGIVPTLRRSGLPALTLCWHDKDWDQCIYSAARIETALIGRPDLGEVLIARYKQAFANLAKELQPATLVARPRILIMGSSTRDRSDLYVKSEKNDYRIYLPPAGVVNAAHGWTGERPDAERILAMDPDYIFLMGHGQKPDAFEHDPRWRGLKAVKDKRVYTMPGTDPGGGGLAGIIFQPLWTRWMAELVHPGRLQPKLRELLRSTLLRDFNYRLSDAQIDELLRIKDNSGSAGYARFAKSYLASNALGSVSDEKPVRCAADCTRSSSQTAATP